MEILSIIIPTITIPICMLYVLLNIEWESIVSILLNGSIMLLGVVCEGRALYYLKNDWTISVIVAGLVFIALTIICLLDYLSLKREAERDITELIKKLLQEEDKFIEPVIKDFKSGDYYLVEVKSKRVHLNVDKEDGVWKLTYVNYITGEKYEYSEEDNKK